LKEVYVNPVLLEINRMFGLPAHPLLVHAAVVLVPLAAVSFIITGVREVWRRAYYPLPLLRRRYHLRFPGLAGGEPLSESVRRPEPCRRTPEQGDAAFLP
jgi:hypothetical protein